LRGVPALTLSLCLVALSCRAGGEPKGGRSSDSSLLAARAARLDSALARSDSGQGGEKPIARWVLPAHLAEISGLALTQDGRLFAHNDEQGRVVEIDYRRGVVLKHFFLGNTTVRADFEGITVAGQRIFLLASDGRLFEFKEGADRARVPFTVHDTRLGHECEFEGVAFDPAIEGLLLACKNVYKKSLIGSLVIYRLGLDGEKRDKLPPLSIPLEKVIGSNRWKGLHPSDITVDPRNGHYVLVSAQEEALIELLPSGEVVSARPLPGGHVHTEGVAITRDGILIISDEGGKRASGTAAITLYRRR
jgi:hypothetical protein